MKKIVMIFCLVAVLLAHADGPPGDELNRIETLSTSLRSGGVTGVLAMARANGWPCPRIPSKWHVENRCRSDEWRVVQTTARDFGLALAMALDSEAPDFQTLPAGEELERRSNGLCDLSEWCAATTGHGNILLAQRSLDIAAVGLARLTANLDWPLESCEKLAERMQPEWMSVAARATVFNDEAGAKLLSGSEPPEELEIMLGTGRQMLKISQGWKVPLGWKIAPTGRHVDKKSLSENLDFFAFVDSDRTAPYTASAQWNFPRYYRIANGLELDTIRKALPLVEFRRVVGAFPEKVFRTPEELRKRDEEIAFYAKQGVRISKEEDSPYYSPMRDAFQQAWQRQPNLPISRYNDYGNAFQAYDEVKRGCFLDQDTINAKLYKDRQDRQEIIRSEMEARTHTATNTVTRP